MTAESRVAIVAAIVGNLAKQIQERHPQIKHIFIEAKALA